jgi:hypothetical protein
MDTQSHLWILTIAIGGMIAALIWVVIEIRKGRNPAEVAEGFVDRLQTNRPLVESLERGYQDHKDEIIGAALRALIEALRYSAPVSTIKIDDKLLKLVEDITTPGAPVHDESIIISTGQPTIEFEASPATASPEGNPVNITVDNAA